MIFEVQRENAINILFALHNSRWFANWCSHQILQITYFLAVRIIARVIAWAGFWLYAPIVLTSFVLFDPW